MDENSIKRIQPNNKEAEKSVIGAMFMDRDVISDVAYMLTKEDFYNPQYAALFESMVELYNEGHQVDVITVSERLRMKNLPEELCKPAFLAEIISAVPTSVMAPQHAKMVKDKSLLRQLIKLSEDTAKDCYLAQDKTEAILEDAEQKIFKLV